MAGIGSAWGSREELLHPRDRHGRFRKKWKMAADAVARITGFLDGFQPRSFQSDQQASQYAFNKRKAPWTTPELRRLHMDWDEANESLQAGEMDPSTKKFVDMMDRNMVETTDDLIVSQTVPTEAFGMSPQQAMQEDGGLEDFIGLEIGDAGYSAANLGSELSHPPGSVTLRVAVPKGTKVAYGGRSPSDRAVIFDRDQPLIVTKVEPDGRGGFYMLAIAGSGKRTKGAVPVADDRTFGRRGAGLTPEQREARISPQMSGEQRLQIAQQNAREMETGPSTPTPAPPRGDAAPAPAPAPAAPVSPQTPATPAAGVPERREPVQSQSIGPGSPEGKSPSDIATDADAAAKAQAEAPPAPAAPPTPLEFQEAARDLSVPTAGKQRSEWNKAHGDLSRGKRDPGDVLRELDTDIEENKRQAAQADHAQKKDTLERNIQAQEQLADLIAEKYGLQRRSTSAPVAKKSPTPSPGAPSTKREATPRAPEAAPDKRTKAQLLEEAGDAGRPRMTKEQLRQAIAGKGGGGEAPATPVKKAAKAAPTKAPAKKAAPAAVPEAPVAPAKKAAAPVKAVAKKAAPAKAAPSPVDAAEEAFKARVAEAGLPDKVADLRSMAREQKIRGFSTMNKRQLQSALLGDEVPRAGKIGVVPPAKMVPHLQAAKSDQEARVLLEKHTLADLKALAQERELELPKRGATKDKVKDAVLADIRGVPEGAGGETPARSLRQELDAQKWVEPANADTAQAVRGIISDTDEMDAAELRHGRDELEKLSKARRDAGERQDANLIQTLADTMGMRAQVISGVEEGPARAPAKRAAKKAVPAVDADAPEVPKTLDKMLKPELEALAAKEGVPGVRKSMTKTQLKDAIEKNRRMDSSRGGESDEERLRRELGQLPGGAERLQGPAAGPLRLPDRAPTPEEIARDNPDLDVQKLFNDAGIGTNDPGGLVGDTKLTLKQEGPKVAAKRLRTEADRMIERIPEARAQSQRKTMPTPADADKAEADVRANADKVRQVADKIEATPPVKKVAKKAAKKAVDRAAETISTQLKGTFGDQLRQEDPDSVRDSVRAVGLEPKGNTSEEIFDNALKDMLENRMRELGMLPEEPKKPTRAQKRVPKGSVKGPKADVPITTEGRRSSFTEAWDDQGFADDPSLTEVRDRVASGDLTQEEGVRRLESEISFHEEEMSDLGAELRGMSPEDRDPEGGTADGIHARRAELSDAITNNKKAIKFLRTYSKNEAPITREELEVKLDPAEKAALDRVEVDDLKAAAKAEGLGNIDGDDKDTVVQNIARKMAAREMANREKEQAARDTQAEKDQKRSVAEAIAGIESVMDGSDRAVTARIKSQSKVSGLSPELRDEMLAAAGDRDALRGILARVAAENGLTRLGARGANSHFDPETHDQPPGANLKKGDPITILESGFRSDVRGVDVRVKKAKVTEGHSPVVESLAPEAPAATPRADRREARLSNPEKKTVSASRLQPGERLRVAQTEDGRWHSTAKKTGSKEITVTRVEKASGNDYVIHGRDDDGNDITLGSLFGQNVVHRAGPAAPPKATKKAVQAARDEEAASGIATLAKGGNNEPFIGSTPEAISARLSDIENPPSQEEAMELLRPLSKTQLRTMARGLVIPGAGNMNEDQLRDEIYISTAGRLSAAKASRGFGGVTPTSVPVRTGDITPIVPVKKVAKAAVPARATPKPVVDLDNPTRHDAEVIGTGLDLDPKGEDRLWLNAVQSELDAGVDGRQIATSLRREADSTRTLHNIQEATGGGTEGSSPQARVNRMELMADRLEGVRPIKKAAPAAPAKAARKTAPKKARPSVADDAVATLLMDRIAERDPAVAKAVLAEISPEDRKELDAARARDTARKAAKKASAPVVSEAVDRMVRQGGTLPGQDRTLSRLREQAAPAPKKRTAAEMKRARNAAESEGVSVDQVLERWDGQKQDRKNLTGPVGEMIAAQIEDAHQALLAADTPRAESEATGRLLHPELRTWATKLGLSPSGTKAVLEKRIADRIKGREAPGASAERAVPQAPGGRTTQPPKPHSWGTFGQRGDQHYYHPDGMIPRTMARLGDDGQIDVGGGESLHNAMGDIASDMVMGRISGDAGVARLRALATKLPAGSKARTTVARLAEELDQPAVAMPRLPDDTPDPVRRLLQQVMTFPIARATGHFGSSTYEKSLVDKIADFVREKASGESSIVGMNDALARLITNHTHESQEGSMGLRALTQPLFQDGSEISQALLAWAKEIRARRRST